MSSLLLSTALNKERTFHNHRRFISVSIFVDLVSNLYTKKEVTKRQATQVKLIHVRFPRIFKMLLKWSIGILLQREPILVYYVKGFSSSFLYNTKLVQGYLYGLPVLYPRTIS